jgi:SanA protein
MKFQAVRFVLYFVFWLTLLFLFIVFVYLDPRQQESLLTNLSRINLLVAKGNELLKFMDDWNYISLVFLFCIFIIILCLNEIFIRRFFPNPGDIGNSFTVSGLIWLARISANLVLLGFQFTLLCYAINFFISTAKIVDIEDVQAGRYTILLLGTSKYIGETNKVNKYYTQRIEKTIEIHRAGLTERIIISGDHTGEYNEPLTMKRDLIANGITNIPIVLDGSGYRTFDSILNTKEIVESSSVIIVSQYFHLERALFLASQQGLKAIGVAANGSLTGKMIQREWLAKTKVLLDIYIFNLQSTGISAVPRRHFDFQRKSDIVILLFVLSFVSLAGRLTRYLVSF